MKGETARRISSLSHEITALKMQNLRDNHLIMTLQEDKRRLDAAASTRDAAMAKADSARAEAETRLLLLAGETSPGNPSDSAYVETSRSARRCKVLAAKKRCIAQECWSQWPSSYK